MTRARAGQLLVLSSVIVTASLTVAVGPMATAGSCVAVAGNQIPDVGNEDNFFTATAVLSSCDAWAVGVDENSGSHRLTLAEHWDGSAWTPVTTPSPGAVDNQLLAVTAVSATNVWAAGSFNDGGLTGPLIEHWNGSHWSRSTTPLPNHVTNLRGIAAAGAHDVWAVGQLNNSTAQQAYVLHWNGTSWQHVSTPQPTVSTRNRILYAVTAISHGDVWAVGTDSTGSGNHTVTLHWNGSKWAKVASPNPGPSNVLEGVSATSGSNAWAAGYYYDSSSNEHSLVLHWNGSSWRVANTPDVGGPSGVDELDAVTAVSAHDAWAVGDYTTGGSIQGLVLHWNGTAWKRAAVSITSSDSSFLYGVDSSSSNDVWIVGFRQFAGLDHLLALHCC